MITKNVLAKAVYILSESMLTAAGIPDPYVELAQLAHRIEKAIGSTAGEERREELASLVGHLMSGAAEWIPDDNASRKAVADRAVEIGVALQRSLDEADKIRQAVEAVGCEPAGEAQQSAPRPAGAYSPSGPITATQGDEVQLVWNGPNHKLMMVSGKFCGVRLHQDSDQRGISMDVLIEVPRQPNAQVEYCTEDGHVVALQTAMKGEGNA